MIIVSGVDPNKCSNRSHFLTPWPSRRVRLVLGIIVASQILSGSGGDL